MKYVKLPIPIDAWQISDGKDPPVWVLSLIDSGVFSIKPYPYVSTLEGTMTGNPGDYLIKGVMGEAYICAKSIFERTYTEYHPDEPSDGIVKSINDVTFKDNPDGSATMSIDMSHDSLLAFARIGINKAIQDAIRGAETLKPMECGFADEDVMCDSCNCWKSIE